MNNHDHPPLDLSTRLRRSQGRSGRTFAATVKLTQSELSELARTSNAQQKAVGEWGREVLLREARKQETDPVFTELIAMRTLLNLALKHIACGETLSVEGYSALLAKVRSVKRKQASEVMQQYTSSEEKES